MPLVLAIVLSGMTHADLTVLCGEDKTDFGSATTTQNPPWTGAASLGGTSPGAAGETGHPGIVRLTSAAAGTSGYSWYIAGSSNILISGNERTEFVFRMQTTANACVRLGFQDSNNYTLPVDGVWLDIWGSIIQGSTSSNSVRSNTSSNYTYGNTTWYRGIIVLDSNAANAYFYLYDMSMTLLWSDSLNANIPTAAGRETGHGAVAYLMPPVATAQALIDMDFMYVYVPCVATPSPSPTASVTSLPTASATYTPLPTHTHIPETPTLSPTPTPSATYTPLPTHTHLPSTPSVTPTPITTGTPDDDCWRYRQAVNISGSVNGAMTDYQMLIKADYGYYSPLIIYQPGTSENMVYATVNNSVYWANNWLSGTGRIYKTNLLTDTTTIIYSNATFDAWQGEEIGNHIYAGGEVKVGGIYRTSIFDIATATDTVTTTSNLSTDECNEIIGLDSDGNYLYGGEINNVLFSNVSSSYPNASGFWKIPLSTLTNSSTWQRPYEDPDRWIWWNVAVYNGTVYGLLTDALNASDVGRWKVISSPATDLVNWAIELDYRTQNFGHGAWPQLIKAGDKIIALGGVQTSDTWHMFVLDGTWTDYDLGIPVPIDGVTGGFHDSVKDKVVVFNYDGSTGYSDIYTVNLDNTELFLEESNIPRRHEIFSADQGAQTLYNGDYFYATIMSVASPWDTIGELMRMATNSIDNTIILREHSQSDFDDLRFRDINGSDIDYWMEEYTTNISAYFWVEIPSIPIATNETTIYTYYGNPTVSTTSSGEDTFIFFDDFSGNMSKWDIFTGTWAIIGSELVNTDNIQDAIVFSKVKYTIPSCGYKIAGQFTTDSYSAMFVTPLNNSLGTDEYYAMVYDSSVPEMTVWWYWSGGLGATTPKQPNMINKASNGNFRLYFENIFGGAFNDLNVVDTGTDRYIALVSDFYGSGSNSYNTFDNIWLGKSCDLEPSFKTWYDEEVLPCPGCPFNLVITSLGGDEAYLNWSSTPYVTNFMVRMRTDQYPANETDGQLVYYGINNFYTDAGLDLGMDSYYYRVWVEDLGDYSVCYTEGTIGGEIMLYGVYGFVCMGLMVIAFWKRLSWVFFASGLAWMSFGVSTLFTAPDGSPAWIFGWIGVILMLGMFLAVLSITRSNRRANRPKPEVEESEYDRLEREIYSKGRRRREA